MLVQVIKKSRIEIGGRHRTYQIGEWVDIGKQAADALAKEGRVLIPEPFPKEAGVVLPVDAELPFKGIDTEIGWYSLEFDLNVLWDGVTPLHEGRVKVGLQLIQSGVDVVVPMCAEGVLAQDRIDRNAEGGEEEWARTVEMIHEMRVPLYHTGLMFVRKCEDTEALVEAWGAESEVDVDRDLAFLRALYQVKPVMLAVGHRWVGGA